MDEDEVPIEDLHAALLAGETTTVNAGPPTRPRRDASRIHAHLD